jgi:hypothetical protein
MATETKTDRTNDPAAHPDPITKAPGAHPVGTGVGAAVGGAAVGGVTAAIAAGAAAGSAVGPVGTVVGAAAGAVVGGLIGKGVAEKVNPSVEHEYWRSNYSSRPYARAGASYDEYGPAYQYGWEAREKHAGKNFSQVEADLGQGWNRARGKSTLSWIDAKNASRDAWDRIDSRD